MSDKIFKRFAELTPSYKLNQEPITPTNQTTPTGNGSSQASPANVKQRSPAKPRPGAKRPTYVPDFTEPKNWLSANFPRLLLLTIPAELRSKLQALYDDPATMENMSDAEILSDLGIKIAGKPFGSYKITQSNEGLTLIYDSIEGSVTVTGKGLYVLLYIICSSILEDASEELKDGKVWLSREFVNFAKRLTYNPYAKIAALLPLLCQNIPSICGLLLMDQKISLITLSYFLRTTAMSKELRKKYDAASDPEILKTLVKNLTIDNRKNIVYDFLVANGTYERVRAVCDGRIRSVVHAPVMLDPSVAQYRGQENSSSLW